MISSKSKEVIIVKYALS